jgi:aspartyl-tRNA synthetase
MTTNRTWCGEPREAAAGTAMTVFGWVDRRRDHGGLIFLDLRDRSGILQVVVNPHTAPAAHEAVQGVRLEYVLRVTGRLRLRGDDNLNPGLATGAVELHADACEVLAVAKTPPFPIAGDASAVDESLRLHYRYLDLRHATMQRNLAARARLVHGIRLAMVEQGFTEIETPVLMGPTPEGARDYLVPSRIHPGTFYALPQSPQLYKQMSMVAGIDRYFQIARCMRDEDLRADRQPEFTQLDLEMSFADEEDVFAATETTLAFAWGYAGFRGTADAPFQRITHAESMRRFGVDKPDTRFGLELCDLTGVGRDCGFKVFGDVVARGGIVKGIRVPGGDDLHRGDIEGGLTDVVRAHRARGLAYLWRRADGWHGSIAKFFSAAELDAVGIATAAETGDAVLMVADTPAVVAASLGALRNHLGRERHLYDADRVDFIWVTDFPMFETSEETGAVVPAHHPFTQVNPEDLHLIETQPLAVRSRAYDLVINGREIASGSIRITDPEMQRRVFRALGITDDEARRKFGFLLEAFEYGVPPHGGLAPGIERLVMEGLGLDNIRDVIAFPKNQQGRDLMSGAPGPVDQAQLAELGMVLRPAGGGRREPAPAP